MLNNKVANQKSRIDIKVEVVDKNLLQKVRDNDGYCICALVHEPDTKCMCKEFRNTHPVELDGSSVTCHCGVYKKTYQKVEN